jgi:AraC-like DNA-binding protein
MGIVASLLPSPDHVYRLQAAIRGRHTVIACRDWAELRRVCEMQPVFLAVLDVYAEGTMRLEPVRQLKRLYPRLVLISYVHATVERIHDVFDAGRAGFDGLVVADRDDAPSALAGILEQAEARGIAGHLRGSLAHVHPSVRDAVLIAVTRAHETLSTEALARALALSRRTLMRRLLAAGFPAPKRLLTWGRLIVAAGMLEDPQRSADGVAAALQFPSGSAFRNTCQRYLRLTPTELRAKGGARWAVEELLRAAGAGELAATPDEMETVEENEAADVFGVVAVGSSDGDDDGGDHDGEDSFMIEL